MAFSCSTLVSGRWRAQILVSALSLTLAACGGADPASSSSVTAASTVSSKLLASTASSTLPVYTVIQVPRFTDSLPVMNSKGQLAYVRSSGTTQRLYLYDGAKETEIPVLSTARFIQPNGLSATGQVVGIMNLSDRQHAFSATVAGGMIDLGTLGGQHSDTGGVNDKGEVVGGTTTATTESFQRHPFIWAQTGGMTDLGLPAPSLGHASVINNNSLVAGTATRAEWGESGQTFVWSKTGGAVNIHTVPNWYSYPDGINDAGQVIGTLFRGGGADTSGFFWSPSTGMVDLGALAGPLGGNLAMARGLNNLGQVAGAIYSSTTLVRRAFVWDKTSGMTSLGTLGGDASTATGVSDSGIVVGESQIADGSMRGFIWSKESGMVDLNSRLLNAPPGLVVTRAIRMAADGTIMAGTAITSADDTGLVLLKPGAAGVTAPVVGAVSSADAITINGTLAASASFTDADTGDVHTASWNWGDGSATQAAKVTEQNGSGSVEGSHVYRAAGVYTITLTVTDSSGRSTQTKRDIVVYDPAGGVVGGIGWFASPKGAYAGNTAIGGRADFRFAALYQKGASTPSTSFRFSLPLAKLQFTANQADWLLISGGQAQYQGKGALNGAAGYSYKVTASNVKGRAGDRVRIQIWHFDTKTNAAVVDYDNQVEAGSDGSSLDGGNILIHK